SLARGGLSRSTHNCPPRLRGRERQGARIAPPRASAPRMGLRDEPFSALDPNTRRRMRSEIIEIWQRTGKTIVFVTHEIDEALELADHIVVLSAKPTRMLQTIDLKATRPRDLNSAALRAARTELKQLLGVVESEETAS